MRCHSIHGELAQMADSLACRDLATITITYAKRMLRLVEDKVGTDDECVGLAITIYIYGKCMYIYTVHIYVCMYI